MANVSTSEFKSGLKIIIDNDPCVIVENEFVKPGKGQAFSRVRIRNLKTGKTVDKTFKSGESVEAADVMETDMQYLYADGEFWHFMVPDTFEQHAADSTATGDASDWISDGDVCMVTLWNNSPLLVQAPNFVATTCKQCHKSKQFQLHVQKTLRLPHYDTLGSLPVVYNSNVNAELPMLDCQSCPEGYEYIEETECATNLAFSTTNQHACCQPCNINAYKSSNHDHAECQAKPDNYVTNSLLAATRVSLCNLAQKKNCILSSTSHN